MNRITIRRRRRLVESFVVRMFMAGDFAIANGSGDWVKLAKIRM